MAKAQEFRQLLTLWQQRLSECFQASSESQTQAAAWQQLAALAAELCKAKMAAFVWSPEGAASPQVISDAQEASSRLIQQPEFPTLLQRALSDGFALRRPSPLRPEEGTLVLVKGLNPSTPHLLLTMPTGQDDQDALRETLLRAQLLLLSWPAAELGSEWAVQSAESVNTSGLLPYLELIAEIYRSRRFETAAYSLVNTLVRHQTGVDQVALAWRDGAYMQVKALSHYERFEKKTDTLRFFEAALEEASDQKVSIHYATGSPTATGVVTLAHRQLQSHLAAPSLFTLPVLNDEGEAVFALLFVSYQEKLDPAAFEAVSYVTQLLLPELERLKLQSAGFFSRMRQGFARRLERLVGPGNLVIKLLTLAVSTLLLLSLTITTDFRVEGNGRFVTDHSRLITAPFDGLITEVHATSGDRVEQGDLLVELDTRDLMFQLAELNAELQRAHADINRARAEFNSINLEIASARAEQVNARIERTQHQLSRARLYAPMSGTLVEGERRELLAAPVSKGQKLLRVADATELYLLIQVRDDDVHHLQEGLEGHFALVSQPDRRLPIRVTRILPEGVVSGTEGVRFRVHAELEQGLEDWWQPGMTGVARLQIERRSWFYVLTHRSFNRIRMAVW